MVFFCSAAVLLIITSEAHYNKKNDYTKTEWKKNVKIILFSYYYCCSIKKGFYFDASWRVYMMILCVCSALFKFYVPPHVVVSKEKCNVMSVKIS